MVTRLICCFYFMFTCRTLNSMSMSLTPMMSQKKMDVCGWMLCCRILTPSLHLRYTLWASLTNLLLIYFLAHSARFVFVDDYSKSLVLYYVLCVYSQCAVGFVTLSSMFCLECYLDQCFTSFTIVIHSRFDLCFHTCQLLIMQFL